LTAADTISGGDGTDTLKFSAVNASFNLTTDVAALTNVTSVEKFLFSGMDGSDTITVNDGVVSAAGGNLAITITGSTGANVINAAGVLSSGNTVSFTDTLSLATAYTVGNGTDVVSMGAGADTLTVTTNAYLSGTDALNGGTGSDTILFSNDSVVTNTLSAAQLGAITNTETFNINHANDTNVAKYVVVLNDSIVGGNVAQGGTFTFGRDANEDGSLKITASSVTSNYNLAFAGGDGADTFIGGAGADSITGEEGVDKLTGGAGKDDFVFANAATAVAHRDDITDFDWGTSTTTVDQIDVSAPFSNTAFATVVLDSTAYAASEDVVVITSQAFVGTDALDVFVEARSTRVTGVNTDQLLVWQDTLGTVHVSLAVGANGTIAIADNGNEYVIKDLTTMSGLSIATIAPLVDIADFIG